MSAPSTTPAPATATPTSAPPSAATPAATAEILPSATCLMHAARLAIKDDKPIQLDYFVDTATKRAFIGEDGESKERVLVKSKDEFTSLIQKMFKAGDDILIATENSIYVVSGKIEKRRVNLSALMADE